MYFPKTQIETNLYSNGDLVFESTKLPYTGPYFSTSDGRYYTGKEPNSGINVLLVKPTVEIVETQYEDLYNPLPIPPDMRFFAGDNELYSTLTKKSPARVPFVPVPYYPTLRPVDIANGEFTRYFVKKSNENIFTEINKNGFNLAVTSKLYYRFSFTWIIKGTPQKVAEQNAIQVAHQEDLRKFIGLGKFLNYNYLQFYQGWFPK